MSCCPTALQIGLSHGVNGVEGCCMFALATKLRFPEVPAVKHAHNHSDNALTSFLLTVFDMKGYEFLNLLASVCFLRTRVLTKRIYTPCLELFTK